MTSFAARSKSARCWNTISSVSCDRASEKIEARGRARYTQRALDKRHAAFATTKLQYLVSQKLEHAARSEEQKVVARFNAVLEHFGHVRHTHGVRHLVADRPRLAQPGSVALSEKDALGALWVCGAQTV